MNLIAASAVAALAVAACAGSSRSTPAKTASAASPRPISGKISLDFTDSAANVPCPPSAPAHAECFSLTGTADDPAFGTVKIGPYLDAEVSVSSALCGRTARYQTLLAGADGTITVDEIGPRLCLTQTITQPRHFTVASGSGRYAGATGSGAISLTPESVGVTELWTGQIALATN